MLTLTKPRFSLVFGGFCQRRRASLIVYAGLDLPPGVESSSPASFIHQRYREPVPWACEGIQFSPMTLQQSPPDATARKFGGHPDGRPHVPGRASRRVGSAAHPFDAERADRISLVVVDGVTRLRFEGDPSLVAALGAATVT